MVRPGMGAASLDSYYSVLFLIYYLVWYARRRSTPFSIGRQIVAADKFDDVLLELHHHHQNRKRSVYLFDIKQRRYKNKTISYSSLVPSAQAVEFSLLKYFKAYLSLREQLDLTLQEFVVWTHSSFNKKDFRQHPMLEQYKCLEGFPDLLEDSGFGIRRYRIRNYSFLAEELLKGVHPLYELAEKVSRLLFEKITIGPGIISQNSYDVLLKDVFEDNHFRKDFLEENFTISDEAKQFRRYLEQLLTQQFQRRNVNNFNLAQIDEEQFASHIKLQLERPRADCAMENASWQTFDNDLVTHRDIEHFFSVLVFYTHTPTVHNFRKNWQHKFDETVLDELYRFARKGVRLKDSDVDRIFELAELKKLAEYTVSDDLRFQRDSMAPLESALKRFYNQNKTTAMVVEACAAPDVSIARVIRVLETLGSPSSHLVMSGKEFLTQFDKMLAILSVLGPKTNEKAIFVVAGDGSTVNESWIRSLSEANSLIICVVPEGTLTSPTKEVLVFKDKFEYGNLSEGSLKRLLSKRVILQGREIPLNSILTQDCLKNISIRALSDWIKCERIAIGASEYKCVPDNFIERDMYSDTCERMDSSGLGFGNITILSGAAGIGKSVVLTKLAACLQEKHSDCIMILQDSKAVVHLFSAGKDLVEIVSQLIGISKIDHFQKLILQKIVEQRRIILLLDGFDEISSMREENANVMLNWIHSAAFRLTVIATRPHRLAFLNLKLNDPMVCTIQPFTENDQLNFLRQRWHSSSVANEDHTIELIRTFRKLFEGTDATNPLEVPLQTTIIASIYEDQQLLGDCKRFDYHSIADIFQAFVDKKFDMYARKFFDLSNRAHEVALKTLRVSYEAEHAELAFRLDSSQIVDYQNCIELEQYGLVRLDTKEVSFIHPFFREFFLSQYLLTHYVDQEHFNRYLVERFCKPTVNRFDKFFEHHIMRIATSRKLLGPPVFFKGSDFTDLGAQQRGKLHADKVKQFHLFLKTCCSEEQLCKYLRISVDKGELNIFEVIYDSLPVALLQRIQFKFVPNQDNFVVLDLSTVSEDRLVMLLAILSRKHTSNIIKKVIANFTKDEDDFVTTSIKEDYRDVIGKLFAIDQSLTEEDEVDLLLEYVQQRWQAYVRLAILHRRDELLELVFRSMADRFHQRVIKYFLMETNFLRQIIDICRDVDETAAGMVHSMIDFAKQNLSNTDFTILLARKYKDVNYMESLNKVQNQTIRALFDPDRLCNT